MRLRNLRSGAISDLACDGVFVAIGHTPVTGLVAGQLPLDADGYVITRPDSTATAIPGVFAAGDVKDKIFRQAVTAAGMGCMAALEAGKFLAAQEEAATHARGRVAGRRGEAVAGGIGMDWDKLRVFHAVAEAGSFTHAGESLNLSQSAVSRQISALEESLSVPLFHRHARGLILTEQGELLFRTAREVFAKLSMAEGLISESKDRPKGPLKITTTVAFGSSWLTPRMREFLDLYPDIQVTLVIDDSELDLSMREADVAIRMSPPRQPDLIQRHLVSVPSHVYAAPDYIKKHGMPQQAEDLDKHRLIVYGEDARPPVQNVNWLLDVGREARTGAPADPGGEQFLCDAAGGDQRARARGAVGFHRHRANRIGARAARIDRAAGRSLFRLSRGVAHVEADQRVSRFSAAQGSRNPARLSPQEIDSGKSNRWGSEACAFCRRARTNSRWRKQARSPIF